MEDNETSDSDIEMFQVEYTASELYALQGLLRYLSIDMDQRQALVAESLAKTTHEAMVAEDFQEAMESEMDEFEEQMRQEGQVNPMERMDKAGFA